MTVVPHRIGRAARSISRTRRERRTLPVSWTRFGIGRSTSRKPHESLIEAYTAALEELRSWDDPAVAGLIARLESRYRDATVERRYRILQRRASGAIRWSL